MFCFLKVVSSFVFLYPHASSASSSVFRPPGFPSPSSPCVLQQSTFRHPHFLLFVVSFCSVKFLYFAYCVYFVNICVFHFPLAFSLFCHTEDVYRCLLTSCPGRLSVQFCVLPWTFIGHSFTSYPGRLSVQFSVMPWTFIGHSFTSYPGRLSVRFFVLPRTGRSLTSYPGRFPHPFVVLVILFTFFPFVMRL